jgi:hypothetical protein
MLQTRLIKANGPVTRWSLEHVDPVAAAYQRTIRYCAAHVLSTGIVQAATPQTCVGPLEANGTPD